MNPISSGTLPAPFGALDATKAAAARRPEEGKALPEPRQAEPRQGRAPRVDAYIPAEAPAPSGMYWLERDADGNAAIHFDDPAAPGQPEAPGSQPAPAPQEPERAADNPPSGAPKPSAPAPEGRQTCKGNTDAVDREIQKLKQKKAELEKQLRAEDDGPKCKQLQQQLSQVESELRQKDNDAYRRQHTQFTAL